MALSLCRSHFNRTLIQVFTKSQSQFVKFKSDAHIAVTDDTSTVVCWHPEKPFPYEFSRPIPKKKFMPKSDSVLKVQSNKAFLAAMKPKPQNIIAEELARITYTTKHIWFPPRKQFKRKPKPAPDRPYL